jgi:transglutaminase-like putative cysteine protease
MRVNRSVILVALTLVFAPTLRADDSATTSKTKKVAFTLTYVISANNDTSKVTLTAVIPQSIEGRQKITKVKYSLDPVKEFVEAGCKYATFVLVDLTKPVEISIKVEAEIQRFDFTIASSNKKRPMEDKPDLNAWLAKEKFIETDADEIQAAAKTIAGKDDADSVRQMLTFIKKTLRYSGYDPKDHGAVYALNQKQGDCTEFSDLIVALCRAKNIPARICQGYVTTNVRKGDSAKHDWAEVYLQDLGWVPIDPLHTSLGIAAFDRLLPIYLCFSNRRNDKTLNSYHYFAFQFVGKPVQVSDSFALTK